MSYGEADVYYQPEKFGLVPVAELELSEPDYSFDLVMVWEHTETGQLYVGYDSGCSCPSPFEDYTSLDKLDLLDYDSLVEGVARAPDQNAMADFLQKVREAMGYQEAASKLQRRRLDGTWE